MNNVYILYYPLLLLLMVTIIDQKSKILFCIFLFWIMVIFGVKFNLFIHLFNGLLILTFEPNLAIIYGRAFCAFCALILSWETY
ncbi:hypothetical protein F4703DRAFT_1886852 [Phycomyces blakesleeanus]